MLKVTVNHAYDSDTKLPAALWAYLTTDEMTTKYTSYFLVYGQHMILPIEFEVPTHRLLDRRRLWVEEVSYIVCRGDVFGRAGLGC